MQDKFEFGDSNEPERNNEPVECLGKTFENDNARRKYYLCLLAEKIKDPEFRKIEGFPIGEDEDILELSDPPYYTACPNPFIEDFINLYGSAYDSAEGYKREPYAADVSEGKSDPIYNAHSYHTKVPHKAIMRYILHYTNPGDIVLDGFCGSGMTGVAAQLCADERSVRELGYNVIDDGAITEELIKSNGENLSNIISRLGNRKVILNDLSPAATFISQNYNNSVSVVEFENTANKIYEFVKDEYQWMYETLHNEDKELIGVINYTIWSDVFTCGECGGEIVFWKVAVDHDKGKIKEKFSCNHCKTMLTKRGLERAWVSKYDEKLKSTIKQAKVEPVLLNYNYEGKVYTKVPDSNDQTVLNRIDSLSIPYWFPVDRMIEGRESRRNDSLGLTHVHHYYTKRNLCVLSSLLNKAAEFGPHYTDMVINMLTRANRQSSLHISNYFHGGGGVCKGHLTGTLYVPSLSPEISALKIFKDRIATLRRGYNKIPISQPDKNIISTGSFRKLALPDNSVDYIFLDPPFGANLNYSELNFIDESWLKCKTKNHDEAIENPSQGKSIDDYRSIMSACFTESYRVLKPGRWLTVEFSNTKSNIWNSIQTALSDAGFIVSNVSALDKKIGSFKAVTTTTAVKQDLVISAYKPNGGFEDRFSNESNMEGVWDFIRTHLGYLPVVKKQEDELVKIPERDPRILFDQVVSYFVRNIRDVPVSSKEFQEGLLERFAERDGMMFLAEQAMEYDKVRITSKQLRQLTIFVDDEASAIEWLRQLVNDKPQSYQDMHPKFINELSGWKKAEEQLELSKLLEQNFLKYEGSGQLPPQIHSYLSTNFKEMRNLPKNDAELIKKAKDRWYVPNPEREEDLIKLRERELLKQFEDYKGHTGRKLKKVRLEAVRCGFKKAWQDHDYSTIIEVAEKIPQTLLQEDQKLLMWYDQAQTRHSDESLF